MRNTLTILLLSLGMTTQAEGVNTIAADKEAGRSKRSLRLSTMTSRRPCSTLF